MQYIGNNRDGFCCNNRSALFSILPNPTTKMGIAEKDGQLSFLILLLLKLLITAKHVYFTCSRSLVVDDQAAKH